MLAAPPAKSETPGISWEPGVLHRGFPYRYGTLTRAEGLEIKFDSHRVDENVTIPSLKADKVVGPGDEISAGKALENLRTVSARGFDHMWG